MPDAFTCREARRELDRSIDEHVARTLGEFKAQGLANSLWAYVKMGRPPAAALQARIDEHVTRTLSEFNAQDLANSLWAYATMGRPPAVALQACIDEHVVRKLGEFNALGVAQVLSAYSTMGHAPSDTLLERFDARVLSPGQGEKPRKCAVSRVLGQMWRADAVSRVGAADVAGPEP